MTAIPAKSREPRYKLPDEEVDEEMTEEDGVPDINDPAYFCEDAWLLSHIKKNVPGVLKIIFSGNDVEEWKEHLWTWVHAAVSNEGSAYEEAHRRKNLMRYYKALVGLFVAFDVINKRYLGKEEPREGDLEVPPENVIREFCASYTWDYCRLELAEWYNGVNTSDDFYVGGLNRSTLFMEYEQMESLLETAFFMCRKSGTPVIPIK